MDQARPSLLSFAHSEGSDKYRCRGTVSSHLDDLLQGSDPDNQRFALHTRSISLVPLRALSQPV